MNNFPNGIPNYFPDRRGWSSDRTCSFPRPPCRRLPAPVAGLSRPGSTHRGRCRARRPRSPRTWHSPRVFSISLGPSLECLDENLLQIARIPFFLLDSPQRTYHINLIACLVSALPNLHVDNLAHCVSLAAAASAVSPSFSYKNLDYPSRILNGYCCGSFSIRPKSAALSSRSSQSLNGASSQSRSRADSSSPCGIVFD